MVNQIVESDQGFHELFAMVGLIPAVVDLVTQWDNRQVFSGTVLFYFWDLQGFAQFSSVYQFRRERGRSVWLVSSPR